MNDSYPCQGMQHKLVGSFGVYSTHKKPKPKSVLRFQGHVVGVDFDMVLPNSNGKLMRFRPLIGVLMSAGGCRHEFVRRQG